MGTGSKASPVPAARLWLTPSEFSAELAVYGIGLCPRLIRERCGLPEGDARRIASHPDFPGRFYIPRKELDRLAGLEASA